MAEPYDTLLQVQEHDTALDQLHHRLEAMPERIALAGVRERGQFGEDDVAGQRLTRIPGFMDLKGTP